MVDAHFHFIDSTSAHNEKFLAKIAPGRQCTPEMYQKDVLDEYAKIGVSIDAAVHLEALPDDGAMEAAWVWQHVTDGRAPYLKAIVGSVNLASEDAEKEIVALKQAAPEGVVKGCRWIMDCVGPFDGKSETHINCTRFDSVDYMRGSEGGYDGTVVPAFEAGFSLLAKHGLSFDL